MSYDNTSRSRCMIALAVTIALLGLPASAQDASDCDTVFGMPGMAAYWTFDDQSAPTQDDYDGHDGINHGATWVATGVVGGALSFDGIGDYVAVSHDPAFDFPAWSDYTIAAWFLNDGQGDVGDGYGQKILAKNTWAEDLWLSVESPVVNAGQLSFVTCHDVSHIGECDSMQDGSHDFACGEWHHVVITKAGQYGEMWVDGELRASSDSVMSAENTQPIYIGFSPHPDPYQQKHWSGMLDEIAIFNRALSTTEIQGMHARSAAGYGYCTGLSVSLDIKPQSCPNPFNPDQQGMNPTAILGTADFDVNDIDVASILLVLPEGSVSPVRTHIEDVATPLVDPEPCECTTEGPDGFDDLTMSFDSAAVAEALGDVQNGDEIEICVTGQLLDGTPFEGCDCIFIPGPVSLEQTSWGSIKARYR